MKRKILIVLIIKKKSIVLGPVMASSFCYEHEWEVKGKDPDAHRSEVKKEFIQS